MSEVIPFPPHYTRVSRWAARYGLRLIKTKPDALTHSVADCIELVARETGISEHDLIGQFRARKTVQARQLVYWLARYGTDKSLPQIGEHIGGRDHTTIASGVDSVNRRRASDPDFRALSDCLLAELTEGE